MVAKVVNYVTYFGYPFVFPCLTVYGFISNSYILFYYSDSSNISFALVGVVLQLFIKNPVWRVKGFLKIYAKNDSSCIMVFVVVKNMSCISLIFWPIYHPLKYTVWWWLIIDGGTFYSLFANNLDIIGLSVLKRKIGLQILAKSIFVVFKAI